MLGCGKKIQYSIFFWKNSGNFWHALDFSKTRVKLNIGFLHLSTRVFEKKIHIFQEKNERGVVGIKLKYGLSDLKYRYYVKLSYNKHMFKNIWYFTLYPYNCSFTSTKSKKCQIYVFLQLHKCLDYLQKRFFRNLFAAYLLINLFFLWINFFTE